MVYGDNSVKTMPNSTKRRPEIDFPCHFAYKNGYRSLVFFECCAALFASFK